MSFGFDPSIILSGQTGAAEAKGLTDMLTSVQNAGMQRQVHQAQLADMMRKQQQEATLANIYRQHVEDQGGLPAALLGSGFGKQAFEAQDQAAQMGAQRAASAKAFREAQEAERKQVGEAFYGVKDQPGWDAALAQAPEHYRGLIGQQFDPAVAERLGNLAVPAEKRAAMEQKDNQFITNPIDGSISVGDKREGTVRKLTGGASTAPPGSKIATYKKELLDSLGADMDATKGRGNLAKEVQEQIRAAESLENLLDASGPFTAQRMHEATMMAAKIANGGNVPTETMVDNMLPKTWRGKSAEFWQSATGIPMDVEMKPFVDLLRNQSERMKGVGKQQIQQYLLSRLVHHPQAFQEFPDDAHKMAEGAGLKGLYDPTSLLPTKAVKAYRYNKDRSKRLPVYTDGTEGPEEVVNAP